MIDFSAKQRIVWTASYPRSGNNWVRAFLFGLHSVFRDETLSAIDLRRLDVFSVPDSALGLFKKYLRFPPALVDRKTIAALRPRVMQEVIDNAKGVVLIKTHNARIEDNGTPFIDAALTAGAIYVVRNPLDIAVSFATVRGIPVDQAIKDMATRNFGHNSDASSVYGVCDSWTGHVRSWLDKPDRATLVVRYEDMRDDPLTTFAGIATHLLMRPSAEQVRKAIALVTLDKMAPPPHAASGAAAWGAALAGGRRWQDVLTPAQVRQVVADHGKQMRRFGYSP